MPLLATAIVDSILAFLGSTTGQVTSNVGSGLAPELSEIIDFASGVFAVFLMVLSLISYRNVRAKRLIFVSAAFGLFALRAVVSRLDYLIPESLSATVEVGLAIAGFGILALFFVAIVKKEKA